MKPRPDRPDGPTIVNIPIPRPLYERIAHQIRGNSHYGWTHDKVVRYVAEIVENWMVDHRSNKPPVRTEEAYENTYEQEWSKA